MCVVLSLYVCVLYCLTPPWKNGLSEWWSLKLSHFNWIISFPLLDVTTSMWVGYLPDI